MSDDGMILLLDIGAELDTRSFEEAMKKFQEWKKKFSSALGSGFFDKGAAASVQKQLEKYLTINPDQVVSPQAIGNITRRINDINSAVNALNLSGLSKKANEAGTAFSKELDELEDKSNEFDKILTRVMSRHVYSGKSSLLQDAFRGIFGSDDKEAIAKYIGTTDRLMAAEKEYEKWMYAHDKMSRTFGSSWEKNTSYSKLATGISTRTIAFDKDTGFSSNNYKGGSAALGLEEAKLESIMKKREAISASIDKANKLAQSGYLGNIGATADRDLLAMADVLGLIDLTTKSLKINNEEGLRAVGISEQQAAKLGLLSNKYGGQAVELQKLEKAFQRLSTEEQFAFKAIDPDRTNIYAFKTALDSVRTAGMKAMKEGITDPLGLAMIAVDDFNKKLSPKETADRFSRMKENARPNVASAMDKAREESDMDAGKLNSYLSQIEKIDKAVSKMSNAMDAAGKDGKSFANNVDIWGTVLLELDGKVKVTSTGIEHLGSKMSELEKFKTKFSGFSGSFKMGLDGLLKEFNNNTADSGFTAKLKLIVDAEKQIEGSVAKMQALGSSSSSIDAFRNSIDATTLAFDRNSKKAIDASVNMDAINKAYTKLQHPTTLLSRALTDLYEKFKILSGYAIAGSLAYGIGNMFREAVVNVVKYDQALHDLRAITQSSSEQTEAMGEKILQVSSTSRYGILEVTEAMKNLGQAGLTAEQTMASITPVTQLATATGAGLKQVSDLVTSVIESFDIPFEETGKVVDILGSAVNRSKLDIEKLNTAFNYMGPVAHDAGVSLEETAAAMSIMSNAGIKASTMATSLRQIMDKLLNPSKEMSQALARAGMTLDDIDPKLHSFAEIIGNLSIVVPDTANALKIFDQRGASAFLALAGAGKDGLEEMTKNMQQVGSVATMYAEQMSGLQAKLESTRNSAEVMGILGGKLLGVGDIIDFFATKIKNMIDFINNLNGPIATVAKSFTQIVAVLGLVGVAVGSFISNWTLLKTTIAATETFGAASTALSFLTTKVSLLGGAFTLSGGWIVAGVAVAIAAIGSLISYLSNLESATEARVSASKSLEKQQEIEVEKTNLQAETAKKYHEVLNDGKRTLEDRKFAYIQLAQVGEGLDSSMMNNIDSVEEFDKALNNSKPVIDSYIQHLSSLSLEARRTLSATRAATAEATRAQLKEDLKDTANIVNARNSYDTKTTYNEDTGETFETRILSTDAKAKLDEKTKRIKDAQASLASYDTANQGFVDNLLKGNKALREKLESAIRNGDQQKISEAQQEIYSNLSEVGHNIDNTSMYDAVSKAVGKYYTKEGNNNLYNAVIDEISYRADVDNRGGSVDVAKEKIAVMGEKLKKNIKVLNDSWEAKKNSAVFQSLTPQQQNDEERKYRAQVKAVNEDYTKAASDAAKVVLEAYDADAKLQDTLAKTEVYKQKESMGGKSVDFAYKEEEITLAAQKKKSALLGEMIDVITANGDKTTEIAKKLTEEKADIDMAIAKAGADRRSKVDSANARGDNAAEKELRDRLKTLKTEFDSRATVIKSNEEGDIAKAKEDVVANAREEADRIFAIKEKAYNDLIALAEEMAKKEAALINQYGGNKEDAKITIKVEDAKKDLKNLRGDRANVLQDRSETDRLEKINLGYEKQAIYITKIKNEHARAIAEEKLGYEQARQALDEKLKKGQISTENHYAAIENLNAKHQQAMDDMSSSWSSGVERAVDGFVSSVGTWADQTESLVSSSFGHMNDSLAEFALTGKTSMQDMVNAMLSDLTRLASNKLLQNILDLTTSKQNGGTGSSWLGGIATSISGWFGGGKQAAATSTSMGGDAASLAAAEAKSSSKEVVDALVTEQTGFFSSMWSSISGFFGNLTSGFSSLFSSLGNMISGLFSGGGASGGSGIFGSILSGIGGLFGFADGGSIPGYSPNNRADNILIKATAGEFMQPIPSVQYYGRGIMEGLRTQSIPREIFSGNYKNTHRSGTYLEGGGEVSGQPDTTQKKEELHIVNILDQGMFNQYMSTSAGNKAVLNIISRNPGVINNMLERK